MLSHCTNNHGMNDLSICVKDFDSDSIFADLMRQVKRRNANMKRKVPNLNETQNAVNALLVETEDEYMGSIKIKFRIKIIIIFMVS